MSKDIEKYRTWVRQGQHSRSASFYYLGKAILEELGEEKGTELIIKQVKEMGKASGLNRRKTLEKKGLVNSLERARAISRMNATHFQTLIDKLTRIIHSHIML
jgi:hypothetical protein